MDEAGSGLPAPRDPRVPERRFLDEEVSAILARAAARESRPDLPAPHDPTLADLMAAAAEAGLDPAEVRRAAAVIPTAGESGLERILGAPARREIAAVLEGARIPADTPTVARWAQAALGGRGKVTSSGPEGFEWRSDGVLGRNSLALMERDGALALTVTTERGGYHLGLWFLGLAAWAALSAVTPLGALPLLGKLLAFLVTPIVVAHPFRATADRRLRARQERLALDVLRLAEASLPPSLPGAPAEGT